MKISYPKGRPGIVLFFLFLLFCFFLMPAPSGEALESEARIAVNAFQPGTMILLGSGLIGIAGWGRKKFRK
ncbi:MAG: PEP-CTERM sorting domain-containing protein [Deltaproteobacteria bacterium]|nr:MAG: PEP-CTERM sorting domain-containing protein [Deltaproteobacteria bacterium]